MKIYGRILLKNKVMRKIKDITGQKWNRLTAVKWVKPAFWQFRCDCGNIKTLKSASVKDGTTKSCGCLRKFLDKQPKLKIIGNKFGRLTAVKYSNNGKWLFVCECGNNVLTRPHSVKSGHTSSCGCYNREVFDENPPRLRHGLSGTKFYRCWQHLRERCDNPKARYYERYGGRGISYDPNWRLFDNFHLDMYQSYLQHKSIYGARDTSIDRIDNDGNYTKENCRWATYTIQARNTSQNRKIAINGEVKLLVEWCQIYQIPPSMVINRTYRGWALEKALTTPIKNK